MTALSILSQSEKRTFECPPAFNSEERTVYFSLSGPIKRYVKRLDNNTTRAGFLLQLAYFRANARFYPVQSYKPRDIQHTRSLLQCATIDLHHYTSTTLSTHRNKILSFLGWTTGTAEDKEILTGYALRQAHNQVNPRHIFIGLVDLCWKHQFCVPSYTELCDIVTVCFNRSEASLLAQLNEKLSDSQRQALELSLSPGSKVVKRSRPAITEMKKIHQGLKPGDINNNVDVTLTFKALFDPHKKLYSTLPLSEPATEYYATWFQKADFQQLTQFKDRNKAYLHLLAFIKHQYQQRQDALVDVLLKSVTSTRHAVTSKQISKDQETKKERNEALQILNNSHKSTWAFTKAVIAIVASKNVTPNEKYTKIETLVKEMESLSSEDEKKLESIDDYLSKELKNQSYYELLEALSNKLQRRVSKLVSVLEFDRASSDPEHMAAIDHFVSTAGKIGDGAPQEFLTEAEKNNLRRDNKMIVPLYKCLLFFHMASAIKSGKLNLVHSYRFKAIQNYLIDETHWQQNKDHILRETGLLKFADGSAYLSSLKTRLDDKYHTVNQNIINQGNPHFKLDASNRPVIKTPSIEPHDHEFITSTLSKEGFTPILKVLKEVNAATGFSKRFKHFSTKHVKMKPGEETLLAGIIGKGCNIGLRKLANISTGISEHTLHNTVTWCFNLNNVQEANRIIVDAIYNLGLANNYINKPSVLHSSSDGRKVNVAVDSLHANYSYKYFGKDKGVTLYTFVDERQSIFHSTVFSSSDREAAYVIDGLMKNDVSRSHIHSTDTHGFSEQIFAATHFIDVDFAPRFKSLSKQRIYGFSAKRTYQKAGYPILPSRLIDRKLILQNWDDILRFMATIKTNQTSASQLFKRLSSYASTHPLYRALKEFGRIIKSQFILTYYDDLELRQQIQKQLNRVELTNKFAHAVFFDNDQAFQEGTKEEQEIAAACQVLLQNSIILWNYLYLSTEIINADNKEEKAIIIDAIGHGSVTTWAHINLRGEYDFTRRPANDPRFDYKKIKALKIE